MAGGSAQLWLRALIFASLAVLPSVRWPGWLVIHRVRSAGQRGDAAARPAGLPIGGFRGGIR